MLHIQNSVAFSQDIAPAVLHPVTTHRPSGEREKERGRGGGGGCQEIHVM